MGPSGQDDICLCPNYMQRLQRELPLRDVNEAKPITRNVIKGLIDHIGATEVHPYWKVRDTCGWNDGLRPSDSDGSTVYEICRGNDTIKVSTKKFQAGQDDFSYMMSKLRWWRL